jgi:N,N'-diacetyllegionaminate synthase
MISGEMRNMLEPYIIGETAFNHEGDVDYLYGMVDDIVQLKLNAVKFHLLLNPESYVQKKHPLIKKLRKWILNQSQWNAIIDYSSKKTLEVVVLCNEPEGIEYILENHETVSAIEIHSSGINDFFLLNAVSKFNGRIVLGIGGSTIEEILYAVDFLRNKGKQNILLIYGFQSYPTSYADINLSKMLKIKNLFGLSVGYADHTAYNDPYNEIVSIMPAVMGFNILEKHYTRDYGKERIDYHAAVGKKQMLRIKELMKLALAVYGEGELKMSGAELEYGRTGITKKAIVARKSIKKGEALSLDNLFFKRTVEESPIKQNQFLQLIGLKATKNVEEDEIIDFTKVKYEFKKAELESLIHMKGTKKSRQ